MVGELDLNKLLEDIKKVKNENVEWGKSKELIIYDAKVNPHCVSLLTISDNKAITYIAPVNACRKIINLLERYPAVRIRAHVLFKQIIEIEDVRPIQELPLDNLLEIKVEPSIEFVKLVVNNVEMLAYPDSIKSNLLYTKISKETIIRALPIPAKRPSGIISVNYLVWQHDSFE